MDLMEDRRRLLVAPKSRPANYLEWVNITLNKCVNNSGNIISENGMALTDYIPVNIGDVFEYTFTSQTANRTRRIYGFDAQKQPVQNIASRGWSTVGQTFTLTATVPTGVAYITASYYNGDTNKTLLKA